jgi:beta-lactamase regulating signal transducer with metallopeptidase domain
VESERAFCFVAGGTIYASAHVWAALSESERAALVAHETAHVHQGDLRMRALLEVSLVLAAPLVGARVRELWIASSERLCDARAADATGEPACVASAMVSLCRLQASRPVASFGFTPNASELAGRVRAVLAGGPIGERAAAILHRTVLAACLALLAGSIVAAEPLHHAFETLLG